MAYGLKDCVVRLGGVLVGKVDPSVTAVEQAADGIKQLVSVRHFYNSIVNEPVPQRFADLLGNLGGHQ
jgi:alpha-D-ribose 1-methylphosphonate 5-phosphate C-P lyase